MNLMASILGGGPATAYDPVSDIASDLAIEILLPNLSSMTKPRITMTVSDNGTFFELYLNEAGRSQMIRELQALDETDEHLHLDPDGMGDLTMSTKAYHDGQTVVAYGKIYLRKDEWDAQYYPHVMSDDK